MRKQLQIVTTVFAIIGLSVAISLSISNGIINGFHPVTNYSNLSQSRILWNLILTIINYISSLIIALAFLTMHGQFNRKIGAWSITIGVLYLAYILIALLNILNNLVFMRLYSIKTIHAINTLTNIIILFREITISVFYLSLASARRKHSLT